MLCTPSEYYCEVDQLQDGDVRTPQRPIFKMSQRLIKVQMICSHNFGPLYYRGVTKTTKNIIIGICTRRMFIFKV